MVRSRLPGAALALVLVLVAAGCGDDDGDTTATDPVVTDGTDAPPEPVDPTDPAAPGDAEVTVAVGSTDLGEVLVDSDGFTLYLFTNDEPGVSNCDDDCAAAWPPLTVTGEPSADDAVTAELETITRDDGTAQVTAEGMPLYRWAGDTAPGDATGQGVGGIWFAVTPDGFPIEG